MLGSVRHRFADQLFAVRDQLLQQRPECFVLVFLVIRLRQRRVKDPVRFNIPRGESLFHALLVAVKIEFKIDMLVNHIYNKINWLSAVFQRFGKIEVLFRLHVVVIHHVNDDIRQVQSRLCRYFVSRVRRVDSGRIKQAGLLIEHSPRIGDLHPLNRIAVDGKLLELFHFGVRVKGQHAVIMRVYTRRLFAAADFDNIGTGRNRVGRQETGSQQCIDHCRLTGRKVAAKCDIQLRSACFLRELKQLPRCRIVLCLFNRRRHPFQSISKLGEIRCPLHDVTLHLYHPLHSPTLPCRMYHTSPG